MGLTVSDTGGGDFKLTPAGMHLACCYRVVDLGTQETTYEGESKLTPQVSIYWELHGEADDGSPLVTDKGEPMTIFSTFTKSLGKKAKLRAVLESWRGRPFTDAELKGFDVPKLLGAWCMVNVTHTERNGKTYANVATVTPLPSALRHNKPNPVLPQAIFDLDAPDEALFATFHEKLREKINNSLERKGKTRPDAEPSKGHAEQDVPAFADMADDIPF